MKSLERSLAVCARRALRLACGVGLLWAAAAGCGDEGGMGGPDTPGGTISCGSDDDCEEEPQNRACRQGRCTSVCPEGMTYVGAGSYTRGCDAKENSTMTQNCAPNAQPAHEVVITAGFCLGKTEVSVGEYRRCVEAGKCQAPADLACAPLTASWSEKPKGAEADKLPINCLLWGEAKAYCEAQGGRLPTEGEWEKAARGTDERRYPWGNGATTECTKGVNWGGGDGCTLELWSVGSGAGSQSLSAAKALDMAGNLWEWTADWYSDMAYKACAEGCTDPTGPQTGVVRVRRGGGYKSLKVQELRASFREYHLPDLARSDLLGVRCARSL